MNHGWAFVPGVCAPYGDGDYTWGKTTTSVSDGKGRIEGSVTVKDEGSVIVIGR